MTVKTSVMRKAIFWRRLWLSMLLATGATIARGQYSIVPLVVSPIYLKAQLWNLMVSNTGAPIQARIQLNLVDLQNHQSVLTAASAPFQVPKGASIVQIQMLEPITYSYNSPTVADRTPNGPLPAGQYQVCYQLLTTTETGQGVVAEDCEEVAVEPLTPPLLTMPEDDSVVTTPQPNFTWMPPTPLNMFSNLTYVVLISEVNEGQSLTDAIQKNLPVQQAQELRQPFLSYPLTGPQLEPGKTYAWQVVALDGATYAAKSDVWSFKTAGKKDSVGINSSMYIVMDGHSGGVGLADSSMLYVKYVSGLSVYTSAVTIKDLRGNVVMTTQVKIKQGDNYLNIPLDGNFQRKQKYVVIFQDRNGRQTAATFTIK